VIGKASDDSGGKVGKWLFLRSRLCSLGPGRQEGSERPSKRSAKEKRRADVSAGALHVQAGGGRVTRGIKTGELSSWSGRGLISPR